MFPSSIKRKIRQFHVPIVSKRGGGQGEWFIQTRPLDKRVPGLKNIFWTYALKFKVGAHNALWKDYRTGHLSLVKLFYNRAGDTPSLISDYAV